MNFVREEVLISAGVFAQSAERETIRAELREAIRCVVWPPHADDFTINPIRKGSGVVPIKKAFMLTLKERFGWRQEQRLPIVNGTRPGPIDAVKDTPYGLFAAEWETGNISSSHRALNKMALGMLQGNLIGGTLVLPTRKLYVFLTDRIGNYREISPYFPLWKQICDKDGVLTAIAVEHDHESSDAPRIEKGTDGRALV